MNLRQAGVQARSHNNAKAVHPAINTVLKPALIFLGFVFLHPTQKIAPAKVGQGSVPVLTHLLAQCLHIQGKVLLLRVAWLVPVAPQATADPQNIVTLRKTDAV